jgi:hypothetical protein
MWYADPLLSNDHEIGDHTAATARQQPINNNRGMLFSVWSTKQQSNSNRGTVLSVWSVPRCYKLDSWSNELVVGESPSSKNVSTEAEDIVGNHHQATTGEDTADWKVLVCTAVNSKVCELAIAL